MGCLNEHEFKVVVNMEKHGGSFVKAIANAFYHADQTNKEILINSFSHYWEQYAPSKWDNNLAEQADQDCKESLFTSDAYLK